MLSTTNLFMFNGDAEERKQLLCDLQAAALIYFAMTQMMGCCLVAYYTYASITKGRGSSGSIWSIRAALKRVLCCYFIPLPFLLYFIVDGHAAPWQGNWFCMYDFSRTGVFAIVVFYVEGSICFIALTYWKTFTYIKTAFLVNNKKAGTKIANPVTHGMTRRERRKQVDTIKRVKQLISIAKSLSVYVASPPTLPPAHTQTTGWLALFAASFDSSGLPPSL